MQILKNEDWFHEDGFPIAVERRDPQEAFGIHTHEFSEIVVVTGGEGLHVTGEDSWPLTTGDVFVIGGSRPHDYLNTNRLQLTNILFQQEALTLRLHDLPSLPGYHALFHLEPAWRRQHQFKSRLKVTNTELATAVDLIRQLDSELRDRTSGFQFIATATFMQIVGHLSRCYGRTKNVDSKSLLSIANAISHLESHFTEPIQLDDLIELSQMSRRSFLRAFESAMGCTPIAHLIRLRIDRAAQLLRTTNKGVTEIAFDAGFNDSNYFSRQFRKTMQCSPREYRNKSSFAE
ncbi:helix-turn-helix domain-containing protein [Novipirellula sp. SH528]|uniref:helix-turn-helix domain-containing protein n=1 Tax=Novipirellula sp. SH528 TaxID=3454466 RepID=UPI003FA147A9